MSDPDRPNGDEAVAEVLRELLDLIDDTITDDVVTRMMNRDLAALGYPADDDLPGPADTAALPGPAELPADAATPRDADLAQALVTDESARLAAERIVAEARRKGDEIIAAARDVAAQYTDAAITRAARALGSARRTGRTDVPAGRPAAAAHAPHPEPAVRSGTVGERWYATLVGTGAYLPVPRAAMTDTLDAYAARLREAVTGVPVDVDTAYRVGAELIALGVNQPSTLDSTLTLLADHLTGQPADAAPGTVSRVVAAVAAGYATGLRDDVLTQQDSLQRATQAAARQLELSLRVSEARYRRLAFFDPLTGLPNRTLLQQRLQQAATRAGGDRHIGVCLIDLVGFQAVNDQAGADRGDQVLAAVARRLQPLAQRSDYLLARCGTDEFAIMVEDCAGTAHLVELADRVAAALATPITVAASAVRLQARVGIVDVASADVDAARVLLDAEIAVRRAKTGNTPWAVHDRDRDAEPGKAPATTANLTDLHTMPLTYQSIVGLADRRIRGLQACARWHHPVLGSLDLRRISDLTGSSSTVAQLSAAVLQQVCRQAMQWSGAADAPYLGINLPVQQIGYPDIVDIVRDALASTGLPPARLQMQLSGIDTVPEGRHSHAVLGALADLGIRISLDDFGTGHTNLAYLRDLPVDDLRTSATLLTSHGATSGDDTDRALLAAMATVAHTIGLTLTVHGVDNARYAAALTGTGCDAAHGHHYGPPASPHQVAAMLTRNRPAAKPRPEGRSTDSRNTGGPATDPTLGRAAS